MKLEKSETPPKKTQAKIKRIKAIYKIRPVKLTVKNVPFSNFGLIESDLNTVLKRTLNRSGIHEADMKKSSFFYMNFHSVIRSEFSKANLYNDYYDFMINCEGVIHPDVRTRTVNIIQR